MRDWEVELQRECADEGAWASAYVMDVENYVGVRVQWPAFFAQTPDDQRETLVHELIHAHLDRAQRVMRQLADQWEDNSACQFAREAHRKEIEICTQRWARIIAPTLPLPPVVTP